MGKYAVKLQRSAPLVLPRHQLAPTEDEFQSWCTGELARGRRLAVDLFSGAGGLGHGLEAAGWTVVLAADHNARALETHGANFPGLAHQADMSDPVEVARIIDRLEGLPIDLVAGGPPCQPFSRAGMSKIRSLVRDGVRDAVDQRRDLWRSFVDVVEALKPRAVLMENVPDMALGDDLRVVREIADRLETAGYSVDYRLLDAWRYGVPQHRKRFLLQARLDVQPAWPEPDAMRPSVRDAIEDLPRLQLGIGGRELPRDSVPTSALAVELVGAEAERPVYDHMTRPVRDDDREAFRLMTPSTLYSDLPDHLRRYRSDTFDDKYKRLAWDDLSRTITAHIAKDGYWYIHPEEDRTLTVREAARLQTFPDDFRFAGTRSDAFRQIGNAVPPRLAKAVAASIAERTANPQYVTRPKARIAIDRWAEARAQEAWWLFPGEHMRPAAALIAAALEVHRMTDRLAADVMAPFRGAASLTMGALLAIDVASLGARRRRALRAVRDYIRDADEFVSIEAAAVALLTQSQYASFELLTGADRLVMSAKVGDVVGALLELPADSRGLRTDLKVGLAQLLGTGSVAAVRMCALRLMTVSVARSCMSTAGQRSTANHI